MKQINLTANLKRANLIIEEAKETVSNFSEFCKCVTE